MATDKNRVVAYLSDDENKNLSELSKSWGLSVSKTIARAVKEVSTLGSTTKESFSSGITEKQISNIIDAKVNTLIDEKVSQAITELTNQLIEVKGELKTLKKQINRL